MITVLFFSEARRAVGVGSLRVSENTAGTVGALLDSLCATYPDLGKMRRSLLVAVNMEMSAPLQPLKDGDEVAVMPPVQGG
jgi:molybdopterin synthase catalytic subunit